MVKQNVKKGNCKKILCKIFCTFPFKTPKLYLGVCWCGEGGWGVGGGGGGVYECVFYAQQIIVKHCVVVGFSLSVSLLQFKVPPPKSLNIAYLTKRDQSPTFFLQNMHRINFSIHLDHFVSFSLWEESWLADHGKYETDGCERKTLESSLSFRSMARWINDICLFNRRARH